MTKLAVLVWMLLPFGLGSAPRNAPPGGAAPRGILVVSSIAFSPDGSLLAGGVGRYPVPQEERPGEVRLWEAAAGQEVRFLAGHSALVMAVAFSPDGSRLATGSCDRDVRLWDPATGRALQILSGHSVQVNSVAFSPDGRTLASGSGWVRPTNGDPLGELKLWNPADGREIRTLAQPAYVRSVAFSPDGRRLAAVMEGQVRLYDPATGKVVRTLRHLAK
jgi:WD40 repeat protein